MGGVQWKGAHLADDHEEDDPRGVEQEGGVDEQECEEVPVVALAHALVEPDAVVVEQRHAHTAHGAVL